MKNSEWRTKIFNPCKQKRANKDSSVYCLYCRKNKGPCTQLNCPDTKNNNKNQCDGCRRGLLYYGELHITEDGSFIGCDKDRYQENKT